ncbi:MAG: SRPBCC domain-containing protein [Candidatus Pedobacter colombiensis]|uniref:SRPBCC domain-containing protein n=1 Tax=Candidatus Pedobacter colombiensis TaxID=3121371 RepID=A0AAJ6B8H3_9SPHI|nr:SRPBCC domain-containing protein [Pedobacter sp.]WEK20884.1 MAG: SRPBCC domain-containing protein [Pedobacter sp.]
MPPYVFLGIVHDMDVKVGSTFDDPNMPGIITNTIWFEKTSVGTALRILQENIPAAIPAKMCYLGWQELLEKLIKLVEPEIPDA